MLRGLIFLASDNINLSLIRLIPLLKANYKIDYYIEKNNDLYLNAVKPLLFGETVISQLDSNLLKKYAFVLCGRNCFEIKNPEVLLDYHGLIFTDDTAFYEGDKVYGDIIFVNGLMNAERINPALSVRIHGIGSLKADYSMVEQSPLWSSFEQTPEKKILFIESGHYPFGEKGRMILAEWFCKAVIDNKDYAFIVKPRYLPQEVNLGKHRNKDHLYNYIYNFFGNTLPPNLIMLTTYVDLSELIKGSDMILSVYSSSHAEAAINGKQIINITGIPSVENADFRRNRFSLITKIIDQAKCNVDIHDLPEKVRSDLVPPKNYLQYIQTSRKNCSLYAVNLIHRYLQSDYLENQWIQIKQQRELGLACIKLSYYENRLDEFCHFKHLVSKLKWYKVDDFFIKYILNNTHVLAENLFDRAFILRVLFSCGLIEQCKEILEYNFEEDTAYLYYCGMIHGDKQLLQKYIERYETSDYDLTDADNIQYYNNAKRFIAEWPQQKAHRT